jgi:hypothetical protein
MPTRLALRQSDTRAAILADARRDAEAFRKKYAHLSELSDLIREIENLNGKA